MAAPPDTTRPPGWPMYRALVGVGLVCALLIVSVYLTTMPVIARNEVFGMVARGRAWRNW